MALPNISGVQQAGVDPQSVQKLGDNNQAIMNALREVQSRLENVMNIRGNVQAGVYGAFGNNFLSRGMIGITDAITDSIDALFGEKEEEKEDPVSKAIKEQTAILKEVAVNVSESGKLSERVTDEITLLRRDIKHAQELQHTDTIDQDKILEQILQTLSGTSRVPSDDKDDNDQVFTRIVDSLKGINTPQEQANVFDRVVDDLRNVSDKKSSTKAVDVESRDINVEEKNLSETSKQSTLLGKIFESIKSINKNLDKLVKSQPMTTRQDELDAIRIRRDQIQQRTSTEDIKTVEEGGKRGFDWSRIFTGLLDFDANLRGFKNIFGSVIGVMRSGITALMGAISPVIAVISKLGTTIASVIASLAGKAMGVAGTVAEVGISLAKKAMPYAIPAAVMGAVGVATDTVAGQLGVGGEQIDAAQDDQNWAKMGFFEQVESGAARGIEHVADFIGLSNFSNEARASRIKTETEYLQKKSAGEGLAQIEMTQGDLRKLEMEREARRQSSGNAAAPIIQDNRVTQNQTIMPTRTVIENPEPAYRRYMNNILQPAR